jgi:hypothetical protein
MNPNISIEEGMQIDDMLNFAHTVMRKVPESCFSPFAGKILILHLCSATAWLLNVVSKLVKRQ